VSVEVVVLVGVVLLFVTFLAALGIAAWREVRLAEAGKDKDR
jgi:hypothetical protein